MAERLTKPFFHSRAAQLRDRKMESLSHMDKTQRIEVILDRIELISGISTKAMNE